MPETVITLPNGWTLRSENGENVRLVMPNGSERIYWDSNEWHEDPIGVMAAVFGAASRCPLDDSYSTAELTAPADNPDSVKLPEAVEAAVSDSIDQHLAELTANVDTCKHCGRTITFVNGAWADINATGDDAVWRETCDSHDTFTAEHEPATDSVKQAATFEERLAAVQARARYMGVNTIDMTDLLTVEIGGQEEDVVITMETAEYLYRQLGFLLGHEGDS